MGSSMGGLISLYAFFRAAGRVRVRRRDEPGAVVRQRRDLRLRGLTPELDRQGLRGHGHREGRPTVRNARLMARLLRRTGVSSAPERHVRRRAGRRAQRVGLGRPLRARRPVPAAAPARTTCTGRRRYFFFGGAPVSRRGRLRRLEVLLVPRDGPVERVDGAAARAARGPRADSGPSRSRRRRLSARCTTARLPRSARRCRSRRAG